MNFQKFYMFLTFIPMAVGCQTSEKSRSTLKEPVKAYYANLNKKTNEEDASADSQKQVIQTNISNSGIVQPPSSLSAQEASESLDQLKKTRLDTRYSVVTFNDDSSDVNAEPSVDDFENAENLTSVDESLLSDSPNDFSLDSNDSDKTNPLLCHENLFYSSWVSQFDHDWLSKNGKKFKRYSSRNKALTQARTNEFIRLVYPSLDKTDYDFPVVINPPVLSWIGYFTGVGRKHFVVWLERGKSLIPEMKKTLEQNGLPTDLVYLSMIESGYSVASLSNVGAVGLWQFMPPTAREYGLKINDWLDERRDVVKSTQAASQYLKDLYSQFGSWHLAAAGYNGGPGLVSKTLRNYGEDSSFFELTSKKRINSQTANYVPKILAALIVAKNASLFGFDSPDNAASSLTKTIPIKRSVTLADIAKSIQVDTAVLQSLNPQLRLGVTPPPQFTTEGQYNLIVPSSKYDQALASLNDVPNAPSSHLVAARIKRLERVSAFAKRYKLSMASLLKSNSNLKSNSSLRKGQVVYVSVVLGTGQYDKLTAIKYVHHKSHKRVAHGRRSRKGKVVALKSKKSKVTRVALSKD